MMRIMWVDKAAKSLAEGMRMMPWMECNETCQGPHCYDMGKTSLPRLAKNHNEQYEWVYEMHEVHG